MKRVSFLGISKDSASILIDLLSEINGQNEFAFYPNKDFGIEPFMPLKLYPIQIHAADSCPSDSDELFFGATGPMNKMAIFDDFLNSYGISESRYTQLIHPNAYIAPSSQVSNGVLVEPGVIISAQSQIDFGVSLKRGCRIGHHNKIGRFTDINPGAILSGMITVGEGCLIGSGAVIKDNITIGANTIIGVGSVVTKDIPANCVAFGNPCKVVREK
jgi:sugar O-acyltransferase (sialic acid O-acetyltransferase NeuD family)